MMMRRKCTQMPAKLQEKQRKAKVQVVDTVTDDECSDRDVQEPKIKCRYLTKAKKKSKKLKFTRTLISQN